MINNKGLIYLLIECNIVLDYNVIVNSNHEKNNFYFTNLIQYFKIFKIKFTIVYVQSTIFYYH